MGEPAVVRPRPFAGWQWVAFIGLITWTIVAGYRSDASLQRQLLWSGSAVIAEVFVLWFAYSLSRNARVEGRRGELVYVDWRRRRTRSAGDPVRLEMPNRLRAARYAKLHVGAKTVRLEVSSWQLDDPARAQELQSMVDEANADLGS